MNIILPLFFTIAGLNLLGSGVWLFFRQRARITRATSVMLLSFGLFTLAMGLLGLALA